MNTKLYKKHGEFKDPKISTYNKVLFIGHSPPSDSDELDGSTLGKVSAFGRMIGGVNYTIVNLFADIAQFSHDIKGNDESKAIDEENNRIIEQEAKEADIVVLAWGSRGKIHKRNDSLLTVLSSIKNIKLYHVDLLTKNGQPRHFRGWDTTSNKFQLSEYVIKNERSINFEVQHYQKTKRSLTSRLSQRASRAAQLKR